MKSVRLMVAFFAVCFVVSLFAGCEEANTVEDSSVGDVRRHRLIATENNQLKGQLAEKDATIAKLEKQLEECNDEQEALRKRADTQIKENIEGMLGQTMDMAAELQAENAKLRAEIEAIKQAQ